MIFAGKLSTPSLQQVLSARSDEVRDTESMEKDMPGEAELLDCITVRLDVFGGKPIIRDMRIAVEHVLGKLAAGDSVETILGEYPFLELEDIRTCLVFAHRSLTGEHVSGAIQH